MKHYLIVDYWMRRLVGATLLVMAGCATPPPVATPIDGVSNADQQNYEQMFDVAVKAMKKMGSVQFANREHGTISGSTPSGVNLEIEIVRDAGRTPQLQVQALLPEGMKEMGNISEPDRYLDIYRQLSQR